jgi:predicted nuclease of predicted toxin-antitoxin system
MWVRTDAPGTGDAALLDLAEVDGRVLLTLDKDFWQIAIQRRKPLERSGVILFRVHPAIPENVTPLVLRTMETSQEWGGHASVVTVDRVLMVRSRRPETR